MVCAELSSWQWLPPTQRAKAERIKSQAIFQAQMALHGNLQLSTHAEEVGDLDDGRKGVFLTKEDHGEHAHQHMDEGVPSGWYSQSVFLKVGERVQREGWYVD